MKLSISLLLCLNLAFAVNVNISNVEERRDTDGVIMDIHDGNTFLLNGTYYYYGAAYGNCKEPAGNSGCAGAAEGACGFQLNHNVSLYTSTDLSSWEFQGHVLQMAEQSVEGILFCPKVLYNPKTKMWTMWYNYILDANFALSIYAVAVSEVPEGPFKTVNYNASGSLTFADPGDFNLFQDDDGAGYIIYTSHIQGGWANTHLMSVEKLSDDYLTSLGAETNSGYFGQQFVEAPAMFKRNSTYYAIFGACCCYCEGGSAVTTYSSSNPTGPFVAGTSLGGNIPSQQTNVLRYQSEDGWAYLWQGDRWQSAPDGIKGHDLSYWGPMIFNDEGNVDPLPFLDNYVIDILN